MNNSTEKVISLTSKKATRIPTTAQNQRGGAYSLNLVCANGNRKSMTVSKKLAERLILASNVYVTVYDTDGCIALSSALIDEASVSYKFSNNRDYIVYNAALVQFLAETFELDYTQRTSISFRDIIFTTCSDIPVAIVTLKKVAVEEEENLDEDESQDNS
jgi:hypothetical protein